jgi:hypothetical protein
MTNTSTRTTGGDPVKGADPGGTRPTQKGEHVATEHKVQSGDRNTQTSSTITPATKAK